MFSRETLRGKKPRVLFIDGQNEIEKRATWIEESVKEEKVRVSICNFFLFFFVFFFSIDQMVEKEKAICVFFIGERKF